MLNRARIAAAVLGLVSFSTPVWAQSASQGTPIGFCCTGTAQDSNGDQYATGCSAFTLTPQNVNACTSGVVLSCGGGSFVQCVAEPGMAAARKATNLTVFGSVSACGCTPFTFAN
jgi:hypothetical protein